MKKKIIILSISVISIFILYRVFRYDIREYLKSRHIIRWSKNVKIYFKDYEGKANPKDDYNIHHYHGIYLKANNIKDAHAVAFFNKEKSWIIDSTNVPNEEREIQLMRFNLHEYYARKINEEIDKIRNDNSTEFKVLEDIYNRNYSELKNDESRMFSNEFTTKVNVENYKSEIDSLLSTVE